MMLQSLAALLSLASHPAGAQLLPNEMTPPAWLDAARLAQRLNDLVRRHPDDCSLSLLGSSREGRDLWVLRVGHGDDVDHRPAIALIAGLDGDTACTTDVAMRVIEAILDRAPTPAAPDPLDVCTMYIVPRANPDATESFFATPRFAQRCTLRPVDDDRDGRADEDGPDDVNCDGQITLMRVIDAEATHLPDPAEPRLLREPDRAKGQKPIYKVYVEGVDDDGDGEYNEDARGGVDLNRNFPHGYRDHEPEAGPHAISEPESKALIDFFLAHPNIAVFVVYGRHDNVVKLPEAGRMDATQRAPVGLHQEDVAIYEQISKRYKDLTGVKDLPKEDDAGSLHAWAYAQFGVPAFACRVWVRPDQSTPAPAPIGTAPAAPARLETPPPGGDPAGHPPTSQSPDSAPGEPKPPAMLPPPAPPAPAADPHNADSPPAEKPEQKPEPADKEAAAWLAYSDTQRDGAGFMPWAPFEHPQLGHVEIGGFVPFFQATPPIEALDGIAAKQSEFLLDLVARCPRVRLEDARVKALSAGVFEIESAVVNDGYFPTATAMGERTRRCQPILVALDVPLDRILGGEKLRRFWSIAGSGGRAKLRWVISGSAGDTVSMTLASPRFDNIQQVITLPEPAPSESSAERAGS